MKTKSALFLFTLLLLPALLIACQDTTPDPALPPVSGTESDMPPVHAPDAHIWSEVKSKNPTCTEAGYSDRVCICGYSERAELPATGHTADLEYVTVKDFTTTEGGVMGLPCIDCGEILDTYETSPGSHNLSFTEVDGGYALSSIVGCTDSDVVIPETWMNKPVVGMLKDALSREGGKSLTSVTIPKHLTNIDENLYGWFRRSVDFRIDPENPAYTVDDNCLIHIPTKTVVAGREGFTIPTDGSVTVIGYDAFDCVMMPEVLVIPEPIARIESCAFSNCVFSKLVLPTSLRFIGASAFSRTETITEVIVPEGVEIIENHAFYFYNPIESIHFPSTIQSLGKSLFDNGCTNEPLITYNGTVEQWNALFSEEYRMDDLSHSGRVQCLDGVVTYHVGHGFYD